MKMFANKGKPQGATPSSLPKRDDMQEIAPKPRTETKPTQRSTPTGSTPDPSLISKELFVVGNLVTQNDIKIEGKVEGDINARVLTVGETAEIKGHLKADEIIVNGRIIGEVRGNKVRLNKSSRVDGDIIHGTISIEAGAHFEGSVRRSESPLEGSRGGNPAKSVNPVGSQSQDKSPHKQSIAPKRLT